MEITDKELENILTLRCDIVTQCVKDYRLCLKMLKKGKQTITLDGSERHNLAKLIKNCENFFKTRACKELGGIDGIGIMKEIQKQEGVFYE